ncbi:hypothetical protein P8Q88_04570 [Qipengyuania sp. XHP0207]|uniref:hypothetical protein n=1 Tax=Qipengyuania sp. XHP0207 TaxID=3038078 RepID=UPI00241FFC6C|nr:hypothetical protein [Qipengyuania sp. XHP0207]MDG5747446.1 hypothetical protein [Qipengyuania sp. XHP0207]
MYSDWPCPSPSGTTREELLFSFDRQREARLLILPPLFDEANKFRCQIAGTMRLFDERGVDTFCPDLPGVNESLAPHGHQSLAIWRRCAESAATACRATHILTIRSSALIAPQGLTGWCFEPCGARPVLQRLLRAEILSAKEAGRTATAEELLEAGASDGITLAGWDLSPELMKELADGAEPDIVGYEVIKQTDIGGRPLWLRAENDFDAAQAEALATHIIKAMASR